MPTLGEALVRGIEAYGIDTVFGIPGVHTIELYRGLAGTGIAHVTPRHEQGAGFMADGHWRATGRVAAAFVISGPGLTNILTPMAQAYGDSVPMLVVSSVGHRAAQGLGGDLHEIRGQGRIAAQAAAFSHTLTDPGQLGEVLARAFAVFASARPRPVHIEVPVDLFSQPCDPVVPVALPGPPEASAQACRQAMGLLEEAERPVILAGGGAVGTDAGTLAAYLDAPVVMTTNARGVVPAAHPLAVPASPSLEAVQGLVRDADAVLALGTEIGRTDYDMYDRGEFDVPGRLIRVDIDPEQAMHGLPPDVVLAGDAAAVAGGLMAEASGCAPRDGAARAAAARDAAWAEIGARYRTITGFVEAVRDALPDAPIVSDSTQAAYAGNLYYAAHAPRRWFNAATGYGALGYGLPAAIGAAKALGGPVVCIAGDGGVQFSLTDLGTAVEETLPVILIVWNNRGYGEIKDYMVRAGVETVGVDLVTPDFVAIGRAYGAEAARLDRTTELPGLLALAAARQGPTVIEVDEAMVLGAISPDACAVSAVW